MDPQLGNKFNITVRGNAAARETLVFSNGFGSSQAAWRFIRPGFADRYRMVLYDMAGSGQARTDPYDAHHYRSLHAFADDLLQVCDAAGVEQAHLITHSLSGMIGALAALKRPRLFRSLVMIGASARYLDDAGYLGGFTEHSAAALLEQMKCNYAGWLGAFARQAVSCPEQPTLEQEYARSLARMRPEHAFSIARTVFHSDHRQGVAWLRLPVLILQAPGDVVVSRQAAEWLHGAIPGSQLCWLPAPGHFPHMTCPGQVVGAIREFLGIEEVSPT
jgi:sigma-B regulation protein RsbQ